MANPIYRIFNYYVAERERRRPAGGKLLAKPYASDVIVSTFFATPWWYGEVVTKPEYAPSEGTIFLVEGNPVGGEELSLARIESHRKVQLVVRALEFHTPVKCEGRQYRYVIQEGYGSDRSLSDCIRTSVQLHRDQAVESFREIVANINDQLEPTLTQFTALDFAKWEVVKDVFRRTLQAVHDSGDEDQDHVMRVQEEFAREVYRRYRIKRVPVISWSKEKRKLARRHPSKEDRLGRALVQGHVKGSFGVLTYSEIAAELGKKGMHVSTEAIKKRSNALGLSPRKPGPPPRAHS